MSYKLGYTAFMRRFEKRFPREKFDWEINGAGTNDVVISIIHNKKRVCKIWARLLFGIKLIIQSDFLEKDGPGHWSMHRRPRAVCFQNRHCMRMYLMNKPKFGRLGAKYASRILKNYQKQCT